MNRRPLTPAGRAERLFAHLIDSVLLLVPAAFFSLLLRGNESAILASFLASAAYYTYCTASAWQATCGKRLMGIYVIRADGRGLSEREALTRFLAVILPSLPFYSSLIPKDLAPVLVFWLSIFWFAPILFTEARTGYHDRLCTTRVVRGKAEA